MAPSLCRGLLLGVLILAQELLGDSTCDYSQYFTSGVVPEAGACNGPTDRAEQLYAVRESSVCGVSMAPFYPDDSATAEPQCGECQPGTTWIEDSVCVINEFCSDEGHCLSVSSSPLWGATCPYEQGTISSLAFCGPGLRCINKICMECESGLKNNSAGLLCTNNLWTVPDEWSALSSNPVAVLLVVITILLGLHLILSFVDFLSGCCAPPSRPASSKVMEDAAEQVMDETSVVLDCDEEAETQGQHNDAVPGGRPQVGRLKSAAVVAVSPGASLTPSHIAAGEKSLRRSTIFWSKTISK
jgi:hypothetical protein